ncbi:MAG: branched-chain amino acid ABC transporter permease [SAR116 cluster bacterium]|nr:branched-chain amino acid ABC transporter permease [SAR116 cluster bacterium]RPG99893.1 MAG: AzlD domain-containing protein [Candidatus Puniceispirillum sp. TMED176]RZO29069.1 MAG: AzlD domain-containing protein [SAR116 cluster bacterium]|tara:strand:- start:4720 stop:5034 length:315 start_codon:yes stop_codon:yes gene_type:complete
MIWFVMIACGLFTYATRFVMFSDIAPRQLPGWLQDALGFVPIAVLTAIIVPAVIIAPEGGLALAGNARLPAALVAVTVALVTRSVLATIATGLGALWCLDWLVY